MKRTLRNSRTTHGLTATAEILIEGEYADDWRSFHDAIIDDLSPTGAAEARLASRVAETLWRLARVARQESALMDATLESERRSHQRVEWESLNDRRIKQDDAARAAGQPSPFPAAEQPVRGLYMPAVAARALFPDPTPLRLLSTAPDLELVIRYEAHLNRQLIQTLALLDALQRRHARDTTEKVENTNDHQV